MTILSELRNSGIDASIATVAGAWKVALGDGEHGFRAEATVASEAAAQDWLGQQAMALYPESPWARIHRAAPSTQQPDLPGAEGIASARADADTYD